MLIQGNVCCVWQDDYPTGQNPGAWLSLLGPSSFPAEPKPKPLGAKYQRLHRSKVTRNQGVSFALSFVCFFSLCFCLVVEIVLLFLFFLNQKLSCWNLNKAKLILWKYNWISEACSCNRNRTRNTSHMSQQMKETWNCVFFVQSFCVCAECGRAAMAGAVGTAHCMWLLDLEPAYNFSLVGSCTTGSCSSTPRIFLTAHSFSSKASPCQQTSKLGQYSKWKQM